MNHRIPAFRLTLGDQDITGAVRPRLVSLTLTEKRGDEADQLDLTLEDSDGGLAIPSRGAVLTLALGWRGEALIGKGAFKVDEVGHSGAPDVVTITARSADFDSALRIRRDAAWSDTTLGAVLTEVAGRNGLTPQISPQLAARSYGALQQSRMSDAALLTRLGKENDAVATIKAGRLIFAAKGAGVTATGAAIPSAALTRQDGDRHDWKIADRDSAYTGVSAAWHDVGGARRQTVRAGSDGKVRRLKRVYATEADARRAADAELGRIRRGGATFALELALARPDLYPERRLAVSGFKPEIDGAGWLVTEVAHTLADGGFTTRLQMELA